MHSVGELVRALALLDNLEDLFGTLLRERSPLKDTIVELELGALDLEDDFLSQLAVDRDPDSSRLLDDFTRTKLLYLEPPLIL